MVIEYIGEIIRTELAETREKQYEARVSLTKKNLFLTSIVHDFMDNLSYDFSESRNLHVPSG